MVINFSEEEDGQMDHYTTPHFNKSRSTIAIRLLEEKKYTASLDGQRRRRLRFIFTLFIIIVGGNGLLPERELRRIVDARLRVDPRGDTPRLR